MQEFWLSVGLCNTKTRFPLRKCCPPGKVYHQFSNGGHEAGERCRVHPNADQGSSILIEVSQQLFFGKSDNDSVHFEANDFGIISGFPEDCNETMVLEPDTMPSDRFYPLINGDLAVPHRFWIFPPESHCMEDFFADHDYNTVIPGHRELRCLSGKLSADRFLFSSR